MQLDGRTVLVSGGASGLGAATAELIVAAGGRVVIADIGESTGRAHAQRLGSAAEFVRTDVTSSGGIPGVDAGSSSGNPVTPDSGTSSSGGSSGSVDSGPPDTTAPLAVADLAATATGTASVALTWTAPADPPGGNVASYEIRRSLTNITSTIEFNAGTLVTAPTPKPQGTADSTTVTGLTAETTYYFAIRAKDVARASAFSRDILGLRHLFDAGPTLSFCDCAGIRLMISTAEKPEFVHPGSVFYYRVGDIHSAYSEL
jgi:NAD(P)-dependent dehydrogenase (short-subunit alcohol dehydrogenase family)